ncbi:MAG: glycoside hydrolase family 1 protein [Microbacteriaceae bacterium]
MPELELPPGFLIGAATAAYQIEGAAAEGGRTPSTWDEFTSRPGTIVDGSDGTVATDHYHRFRDDVALMKSLGLDVYRFSISWTRLLRPDGTVNPEGAAFYSELLDELIAAGIKPMVTLFHWDTPLELERRGGWRRRATAEAFGRFADIAAGLFVDRVHSWITINEACTVTLEGHGLDVHAPGLASSLAIPVVARNLLLGHGLAVQALRRHGAERVGITNVHTVSVPATDSPKDAAYADLFDFLHNRLYADPVLRGTNPTPPRGVGPLGAALGILSRASKRDRALMSQPLDFYGLNYYFPSRIAAGSPPPGSGNPDGVSEAMDSAPFYLADWPEFPQTGFGWPIAPEYLGTVIENLAERYGHRLPPIIVTEGGASFPDEVGVPDAARIDYLRDHMAVAAADPRVQGYIVWTLLDNFEWAAGYTQRFGLVQVDFATLVRTPKASFSWLQRVLERRRSG